MGSGFELTSFGRLIAARALPGLLAIVAAERGRAALAACLLLLAVAADVLADSIADRRSWSRGASDVQIEGFVDFVCFGWAPFQLALALSDGLWVISLGLAFVVAGALRLARFNVEGLRKGGYRGLPITYSGVVIPAAWLLAALVEAVSVELALSVAFAVMAPAMVSGRLTVPRVSL